MDSKHGTSPLHFLESCSKHQLAWAIDAVAILFAQRLDKEDAVPTCDIGEAQRLWEAAVKADLVKGDVKLQSGSTFSSINDIRVDVDTRDVYCIAEMQRGCISLALGKFSAELLQHAVSPLATISKTFRTRLRLSIGQFVRGILQRVPSKIGDEARIFAQLILANNAAALELARHTLGHASDNDMKQTNASDSVAKVYHKSPKHPVPSSLRSQKSISLVMPAAGRSSRFPNMKPKWQLTQPSGRLMFVDAMSGLDLSQVKSVYVGLLQEHVDKFCGGDVEAIFKTFESGIEALQQVDLYIVVVPHETRDQVETLEWIIKAGEITGPVVIKDCDNDFVCKLEPFDGIAVLEIVRENEDFVYNVASKAFVGLSPDAASITSIVEKKIISPYICIGAYSFARIEDALQTISDCRQLLKISNSDAELAVSDVFWAKLLRGNSIKPFMTSDYQDWGTLPAWQRFCSSFKTLFVDIDGTLMKNSGEYFEPRWGSTPPLPANVDHLRRMHQTGRVKIILTTSRTEAFREPTLKQLEAAQCPYDQVIFGLQHSQRVVINDFAPTNPFPSAQAVNIVRNSETLAAMLPYQ